MTDQTPAPDAGLRCVCGDPVQWMDHPDKPGWIHSPGSDTRCLDARPRCPACGMPHDLTPGSVPMAVCQWIRDRIAAGDFPTAPAPGEDLSGYYAPDPPIGCALPATAQEDGLRPRSERCPDPECTDEAQCWRCDAEEAQHAGQAEQTELEQLRAELVAERERNADLNAEIADCRVLEYKAENARLRARIDEYRESRRRWMDAAYRDRHAALDAEQRAQDAERRHLEALAERGHAEEGDPEQERLRAQEAERKVERIAALTDAWGGGPFARAIRAILTGRQQEDERATQWAPGPVALARATSAVPAEPCRCSNGYECPHRCWHCKADRAAGCEEWCHIRPFDTEEASR